jgi:hypothetical protein
MRRLPAFARDLMAKRRQGLAPASWDLCISCHWEIGKSWPWRIVVPATEDPAQFDFRIVAGLSCLLLGHDQAHMDRVARTVIPYEPLCLIGVRLGGNRVEVYLPNERIAECAA